MNVYVSVGYMYDTEHRMCAFEEGKHANLNRGKKKNTDTHKPLLSLLHL